jgi:hypothetical protein
MYDVPTWIELVSNMPTADPRKLTVTSGLTPSLGIRAAPIPMPAPIPNPNGR